MESNHRGTEDTEDTEEVIKGHDLRPPNFASNCFLCDLCASVVKFLLHPPAALRSHGAMEQGTQGGSENR